MKQAIAMMATLMAIAAPVLGQVVGTGYVEPLPGGKAVTFVHAIIPELGEMQLIGSPAYPAETLQLVGYLGSVKTKRVNGTIGVLAEYNTRRNRLSTLGSHIVLKSSVLGGKLFTHAYLGIKPEGGPVELNSPNNRLVWPLEKNIGAGLGWQWYARTGKPSTFSLGPIVELGSAKGTLIRLRVAEHLLGKQRGELQIRAEVYTALRF